MWRTEFDFGLVYLSKRLKLHLFQCACCLEHRKRDNIVRFCDLSIQVATVVFDYRSLSFALREKLQRGTFASQNQTAKSALHTWCLLLKWSDIINPFFPCLRFVFFTVEIRPL